MRSNVNDDINAQEMWPIYMNISEAWRQLPSRYE